MAEKAVRLISSMSIVGLVSTARKYPCKSMVEKTSIWRKIAPPKQLSPTLWTNRLILCASFWSRVMFGPENLGNS
jgi:hypothetical protein